MCKRKLSRSERFFCSNDENQGGAGFCQYSEDGTIEGCFHVYSLFLKNMLYNYFQSDIINYLIHMVIIIERCLPRWVRL